MLREIEKENLVSIKGTIVPVGTHNIKRQNIDFIMRKMFELMTDDKMKCTEANILFGKK